MIPMTVMVIVSILMVVLPVGIAIWKMKGLPESISAMVYLLPKGGWRWLWTLWIWAVGALTMIPMIEALDGKDLGIVGFVTLVLVYLVGAWPLFDEGHRTLHNVLGVSAGILSQLCVILVSPLCMLSWSLFALIMAVGYVFPNVTRWCDGKVVFISEMLCLVPLWMSDICIHLV